MKKKDMDFLEALKRYNISFFGDEDKDQIPNVFDCKPLDPKRDGIFGRTLNVLSGGKYGQTKEEYEEEKISKIHFERDPTTGKVIKITENGKEISPYAKSSNQLIREYREEKFRERLEKQKAENTLIKQKTELQKLKAKEQELLLKQKLQAQQFPQPSMLQDAASLMFGIPTQNIPPQRPGYYIESTGPKLPKGYHWKKIPKKQKKTIKQKLHNYPNYIEHQTLNYQEALFIQNQIRQKYGYNPEIFKVTHPMMPGQVFYVVVEPIIMSLSE